MELPRSNSNSDTRHGNESNDQIYQPIVKLQSSEMSRSLKLPTKKKTGLDEQTFLPLRDQLSSRATQSIFEDKLPFRRASMPQFSLLSHTEAEQQIISSELGSSSGKEPHTVDQHQLKSQFPMPQYSSDHESSLQFDCSVEPSGKRQELFLKASEKILTGIQRVSLHKSSQLFQNYQKSENGITECNYKTKHDLLAYKAPMHDYQTTKTFSHTISPYSKYSKNKTKHKKSTAPILRQRLNRVEDADCSLKSSESTSSTDSSCEDELSSSEPAYVLRRSLAAATTNTGAVHKSPRIPDEILKMDTRSIQLYLRILETGTEIRHDIRVIVVGKRGAGKTCLIRRLLCKDASNVQSTNGIEIHVKKCKVRLSDGKWMFEKGSHNTQQQTNARLLNSVLRHIKITSATNVTHVNNQLVQSDPKTDSFQHKVISKDKAPNQYATDNKSYKSACKDLRDVIDAELELDSEDYATLTLWDFAGDREFYNTHQTFLSHNAIYLVVTNLVDENHMENMDILKFWFDSIHCYGEARDCDHGLLDPPILAVGTHKDLFNGKCEDRLKEQVKDVIHDSRRHLRSSFAVSNKTDDNDVFNNIKQAIFHNVKGKTNFRKELPLKFILLEKTLNEMQDKERTMIISFSEISTIAASTLKPILYNEEIDLFLRYHHDIGNLIYFSDIPDFIILDPQWLANAFSSIVTAEKFQLELLGYDEWDVFQKTGMLKTGLLNAIFTKQPKNIQNYKDHVIKVMEKFDIIIRPKTSTEESHYFVPCMIKTSALSNIDVLCKVPIGGKTSCLCFVFNFLPRAFINHLIVSCIRTFSTSKVRNTVDNRKQPALFHELGVFDITNTGCEKLLVAVFQNTVQIQIWKYGNIKHRVYSDVEYFISGEIKRIQCEKYRMVNMTHSKQFKCHDTKYDNLEGLKNCHIYQNGQEYQCEEHDAVHEFTDDWFEVPQISDGQIRKESGVKKEEKQLNELATIRVFERLEDHKTKRRKEKRGDVMNLKDTEELHAQSQHKQPAYRIRLQKNFKNIVSTITHETIIDHLISEEIFSFDDYQIIDSYPAQTQKNRKLVHLLLSRGDRGYNEFIKALRLDSAYMDLADKIEDTRLV